MNRKLVSYFVLAYALSWSVFVPLALAKQNVIAPLPAWLHIIGAFGPFVSAFIVTAATMGRAGVRELLDRITRWRIGWIWWAVALLSPVVLFFLGALVAGIVAGDWSVMGQFGAMAELPQSDWGKKSVGAASRCPTSRTSTTLALQPSYWAYYGPGGIFRPSSTTTSCRSSASWRSPWASSPVLRC